MGEVFFFPRRSSISNWSIKLARLHAGLLRLLSPTWPLLAALPHTQKGAAPMGSSATPCSGHLLSNDKILAVWSQLTLYSCQVIYRIMSVYPSHSGVSSHQTVQFGLKIFSIACCMFTERNI